MKNVTAAGGVLHRQKNRNREVLLILRNGVWDIPKGKKEDEESIAQCAQREVAEEVGIPRPQIECFLTKTYHEYEREQTHFGKFTHWYRMQAPDLATFTPQKVEGIKEVAWVSLQQAASDVGYKNLQSVLDAFKNSFK